VGVRRHCGLSKGDVEHHVCGLAAHAGQGLKRLSAAGNLAAVVRHQEFAGLHQVAGFAAEETNGLNMPLQPGKSQIDDFLWGIGHHKQAGGGLVHAHVCGLRGQQHCGEKLEHAGVRQLGLRVRVRRRAGG
jgi:hypothetical protein